MSKTTRKLESWSNVSNLLGVEEITTSTSLEVDIELIKLPPSQNRKYFDEDKLTALAKNIKENGVLQPIIVRKHPLESNCYELISGERRLRASKIAQLNAIPVILHECDEKQAKNIQLWENLNREQLNAYEETRAIMDILMSILETSQDEIVSLLFKMSNENARSEVEHNVMFSSETLALIEFFDQTPMTYNSYLKNRVPLLSMPEDVTEYLASGKIEYTKLVLINKVKDDRIRSNLLKKTYEEKLSLTQIKELVAEIFTGSKPERETTLADKYDELRKRLRKLQKRIPAKSQKLIYKSINQIEDILNKLEAQSEE